MSQDLQQLTPEETDVTSAVLVSDAPLYDIALHCALTITDVVEVLARPHVKAYLEAARNAARTRLDTRAADLAPAALSTLDDIAHTRDIPAAESTDWDAEPTTNQHRLAWQIERRRAATTIIRTATAYRRRTVPPRSAPRCAAPHTPTTHLPTAAPPSPTNDLVPSTCAQVDANVQERSNLQSATDDLPQTCTHVGANVQQHPNLQPATNAIVPSTCTQVDANVRRHPNPEPVTNEDHDGVHSPSEPKETPPTHAATITQPRPP